MKLGALTENFQKKKKKLDSNLIIKMKDFNGALDFLFSSSAIKISHTYFKKYILSNSKYES